MTSCGVYFIRLPAFYKFDALESKSQCCFHDLNIPNTAIIADTVTDFYNIFEIRFKRGNTCVKNVKRRPFVSKTALYGCLYLQMALYSIS